MARGKLITIEGCEGVGKSTQIRLLKEYLDSSGVNYVLTREPGGSKTAERIRDIILSADIIDMSNICEAFLYAAARAQHIKDIIEPSVSAGKLVICDRYTDSTFAYQGYARGLGEDFITKLNNLAAGEYMPDLTVFLDYPPELAFGRKGGADKADRLEKEDIEFHKKVYEGYKIIEKKDGGRFVSLDASGTKYETNRKLIDLLKTKNIIV